MAKDNKECTLCHIKYSYCPTCNTREPLYKNMFCSENCKDIFDTICKLRDNVIDGDTARNILINKDLSRKEFYSNAVKDNVNNALSFATLEVKNLNTVYGLKNEVSEETVAEENTEEVNETVAKDTVEEVVNIETTETEKVDTESKKKSVIRKRK